MEQKEGKTEDGTAVAPEMVGGGASAEKEATSPDEKIIKEGPPGGAGKQAPAEDSISAEFHGEANGLDEVKVESKEEVELQKEDDGKKETTVAPQEMTDKKGETNLELKEAEGKEEAMLASEKQKADEKEAKPESREKGDVNDEAKAEAQEKASAPEAKSDSQKKAAVEDEATAELQEVDVKEEMEPGGPDEEQDQGMEGELEEGAEVLPSSPDEWPESPMEEGSGLSPEGLSPDAAASGETSPSASESSPSNVPQSPAEPPPSQEKKKEKAPERRVSAPTRPRMPRAQNRKAIVDKFGGAASGPTALFRNTKAAGAAIGGVKNMLLEWCRAMTRKYEHVDIQNFSSSWSSGMAFCALIHKFFPDAFDYAALDPTNRRHNFTLAFSTAEKLADCAQLLEVDDMVRLAVPDSKCVYTYIQELYRSLVQKGLVKTKKK
nr:PREDICTED: LOW QUALITY PROTEIN: smoothelin-like protein 1 [Camelus bactrianus]